MRAGPVRGVVLAAALAAGVWATASCRGRESVTYSGPFERDVNAAIPKIEGATGLRFK